jgi:TldD protein
VILREKEQELTILSPDREARGTRYGTVMAVQVVAAENSRLERGYEVDGLSRPSGYMDEAYVEELALKAAVRAVKVLKADPAPAGEMPVVLSAEAGGTMIHEAIGHGLENDLAGQGFSVYSGKVGEKVASPLITVVDDPTIPEKRGSYAFDDEGIPARRNVLVEEGRLVRFISDILSSFRYGGSMTGNGRRQSFRHPPIPRMSNTLIAPGQADPQEIIRDTDRGLLVTKMGGGQVNTVNGDFVFEVSEGYRLEKGRKGPPVRGALLIGNGPAILKEIDAVGRDLGYGVGTCGKEGQGVPVADAQPTLRIPRMVVGGRLSPE